MEDQLGLEDDSDVRRTLYVKRGTQEEMCITDYVIVGSRFYQLKSGAWGNKEESFLDY